METRSPVVLIGLWTAVSLAGCTSGNVQPNGVAPNPPNPIQVIVDVGDTTQNPPACRLLFTDGQPAYQVVLAPPSQAGSYEVEWVGGTSLGNDYSLHVRPKPQTPDPTLFSKGILEPPAGRPATSGKPTLQNGNSVTWQYSIEVTPKAGGGAHCKLDPEICIRGSNGGGCTF